MKKIIILLVALMLILTACEGKPDNTENTDEARKEKLRHAAEMRDKFKSSDLNEYGLRYLTKVFKDVYPDIDIDLVVFTLYKEEPTESEVAPLNGDEEKAFELLQKANFTISITDSNYNAIIPEGDRRKILDALCAQGFTAKFELGYYEYDYIKDGEVHIEPKPMY